MEEINLQDLFKYFVSKILVIVLVTVFFGLIGSLYLLFMQTPMYKSTTTLLLANVSGMDGSSSSITTNDITLNQKLVSTYREIIKSANKYLTNQGRIFFEIGCEQAEAVSALLCDAGFQNIRVIKDLAGLDRVVCATLV